MSYVNSMSSECRLYGLYELGKLYQHFYESLKITWNHLTLVFKNFGIFLFIYKDGKANL